MPVATKPTAPPWNVAHSGYANTPFVIYSGDKKPNFASRFPLSGVHAIAEVFHDEGPDHEEQRANATLLAAAPDLLEAVRFVKEFFANLEDGLPADDPISKFRQKFHAPLHAKVDAALLKVDANV